MDLDDLFCEGEACAEAYFVFGAKFSEDGKDVVFIRIFDAYSIVLDTKGVFALLCIEGYLDRQWSVLFPESDGVVYNVVEGLDK